MRKLLGSLMLCLGLSLLANLAHASSSNFYYGAGVSDGSIKVNSTDSKRHEYVPTKRSQSLWIAVDR